MCLLHRNSTSGHFWYCTQSDFLISEEDAAFHRFQCSTLPLWDDATSTVFQAYRCIKVEESAIYGALGGIHEEETIIMCLQEMKKSVCGCKCYCKSQHRLSPYAWRLSAAVLSPMSICSFGNYIGRVCMCVHVCMYAKCRLSVQFDQARINIY